MQKKQRGVALIYVMILSSLTAMVSVAVVEFSSLEQKMSANYRMKQRAFGAAEAALSEAEQCLKTSTSCSDLGLFNSTCNNGLCFSGSDKTSVASCSAGGVAHWDNGARWKGSSTHKAASTLSGSGTSAKYMIEFLCYYPKNPEGPLPSKADPTLWDQLYRVTALGTVGSTGTQVMLQTTFVRRE